MQLHFITRTEFLDMSYKNSQELLRILAEPAGFVVRQFYPASEILSLREKIFLLGLASEPSWHPLYDQCPDYHRLHDNYPNAYVKAKMHAFYFHGWYAHNRDLFQYFNEIFLLKNFLGEYSPDQFLRNVPSNGHIARVNFQNYPAGGGYQAEHIDQVGRHAQVQTLIQASDFGRDFSVGGLFARETPNSEKLYLDPITAPGDMIVISPGIPHGVDPIDPDCSYEWRINHGRWIIIPLVVSSDYPKDANDKPQSVISTAHQVSIRS